MANFTCDDLGNQFFDLKTQIKKCLVYFDL